MSSSSNKIHDTATGGVPQNDDNMLFVDQGHGTSSGAEEFHASGNGDEMLVDPFNQGQEIITDTSTNTMSKRGVFNQRNLDQHGDVSEGSSGLLRKDFDMGEDGHNLNENEDNTERPVEGMTSEVEAIARQAKNQMTASLEEMRALSEDLFSELTQFLEEAVGIQNDFQQVQMAVQAESDRLDTLQPTVDDATRIVLS